MNSLLHALNIGTLATWLSVGGVGTVGIALPVVHRMAEVVVEEETEATLDPYDLSLGDPAPQDAEMTEGESAGPAEPVEVEEMLEVPEAPPELPELAEVSALPEIPDLPPPPKPKPATKPSPSASASNAARGGATTSKPTSGSRGGSGSGKPAAGGQPGGSGMSTASRLAAGRMPSPSYPAAARRQGQTGTVVVEFTIDTSGRVISAYAKSPSKWPLLNDEAVRTVKRWKFPPGPVMKLQRPIIFQLR